METAPFSIHVMKKWLNNIKNWQKITQMLKDIAKKSNKLRLDLVFDLLLSFLKSMS
ncbi:hypothetical protein VS_0356 [Vibrio atlanticus]|uniref:Uncharacterized protein n=1 Tax=Vibrio atlanticus (strain LGP32) TaxID=575788 RepID=B7VIC8_VIBA3|nr:hypothetical protein VS_0356 [Vibrio atlanticus]